MNIQPEISIVTVNYNGLKDTLDLLGSLYTHLSPATEIIVVDNGSKQDETTAIRQQYPGVKCIRSEINKGFAGGNNLGIRQAKGQYILFLNNDTYLEDNSVNYLVDCLKEHPNAGAVSPKIKFAFPPQNIQFAGYTTLSTITLRNHLIGFGQADSPQFDRPGSTPYLHGAAMLVKREVIDKVGEMPEIYFLYYEELDWCTRMTEAGYELRYEPRCTVFHKESQSTGQESPLRTFYLSRNRMLYARRNRKGMVRYCALIYQLCIANPKNILSYLCKNKPALAYANWKGITAYFRLSHKTD